jgi:hypothetical protein
MRHIREISEFNPDDFSEEDLKGALGDLETLGFEPYVGYAWNGTAMSKNVSINNSYYPLFFLVIGKNEEDCIRQMMESPLLKNHFARGTGSLFSSPSPMKKEDLPDSFEDYLSNVFSWGGILDAGYYGPFKAKKNERKIAYIEPPYTMNVQQVMDVIEENFRDVRNIMIDADYNEVMVIKPKTDK